MDDVYDLFKRGTELLEAGDFNSATVPLSKAAGLEPEKTSIREALGRAYFRSSQFEEARVEFEAVVERAPTNDYALFCLGRALLQLEPRPARIARAAVAERDDLGAAPHAQPGDAQQRLRPVVDEEGEPARRSQRADVVALRYGRSRHPGWSRLELELEVPERHGRGLAERLGALVEVRDVAELRG